MSAISGVSSQMPVYPPQPATSTKPSTSSPSTPHDTVNISESARQAALDSSGTHAGVDVDHDGDHS